MKNLIEFSTFVLSIYDIQRDFMALFRGQVRHVKPRVYPWVVTNMVLEHNVYNGSRIVLNMPSRVLFINVKCATFINKRLLDF